ncbi:hypothetical protein GEMRC1_004997 [Eukaryota sp. GEM-RC1]
MAEALKVNTTVTSIEVRYMTNAFKVNNTFRMFSLAHGINWNYIPDCSPVRIYDVLCPPASQTFPGEMNLTLLKKKMENPTTLSCGHSFCRDKCLVQWLKQKEAASCPVFREPIPSTPLRVNIALREAIEIAKNTSQDSILCFELKEKS